MLFFSGSNGCTNHMYFDMEVAGNLMGYNMSHIDIDILKPTNLNVLSQINLFETVPKIISYPIKCMLKCHQNSNMGPSSQRIRNTER